MKFVFGMSMLTHAQNYYKIEKINKIISIYNISLKKRTIINIFIWFTDLSAFVKDVVVVGSNHNTSIVHSLRGCWWFSITTFLHDYSDQMTLYPLESLHDNVQMLRRLKCSSLSVVTDLLKLVGEEGMLTICGIANGSVGLWLDGKVEGTILEDRSLLIRWKMILIKIVLNYYFSINDDFCLKASSMSHILIEKWFGGNWSLLKHLRVGIRFYNLSIL